MTETVRTRRRGPDPRAVRSSAIAIVSSVAVFGLIEPPHDLSRAGFTILTPLPGTAYFEEARPRLRAVKWSQYDMHHLLWEPRLGALRFFEGGDGLRECGRRDRNREAEQEGGFHAEGDAPYGGAVSRF